MGQEIKLLDIKNLVKVFTIGSGFVKSRITAVDNVSFDLESGRSEIFTLAGESGSGKTTLARIILGFIEPTSGKILYKGKNITEIKGRKEEMWFMREVQPIFQNPFETFNPLKKVDSYLYETVVNYGIANKREDINSAIDEALNLVGISFQEIQGRYPHEFSGGQLQRISIARALITKPSLLIADEPVSMVDASLKMSICNLFKDLKEKQKVNVIYITHDLATSYYVSDRIAIMFRGTIVEIGPVEKILIDPKHPYTKILRDSVPEPDPEKRWKEKIKLSSFEEREFLSIGCKFADRCPYVMDICKKEAPNDIILDGVTVKCHLYSS
ncbi:MAG TPA: ABC transporter ATP-binding protein [bacterium]|nr:ABC transporter ATP-binding protein [bacterium]HRR91588.1 ABC transporter ATP-binding protein [bacterium]